MLLYKYISTGRLDLGLVGTNFRDHDLCTSIPSLCGTLAHLAKCPVPARRIRSERHPRLIIRELMKLIFRSPLHSPVMIDALPRRQGQSKVYAHHRPSKHVLEDRHTHHMLTVYDDR